MTKELPHFHQQRLISNKEIFHPRVSLTQLRVMAHQDEMLFTTIPLFLSARFSVSKAHLFVTVTGKLG